MCSGVRLREIAAKFDIGETAIIEASRRFQKKMADDENLRVRVEKVKGFLKNE
jgi:transposase